MLHSTAVFNPGDWYTIDVMTNALHNVNDLLLPFTVAVTAAAEWLDDTFIDGNALVNICQDTLESGIGSIDTVRATYVISK